ncbi:coiled-coil domain-containing protein 82-like [Arapaima gigas]
MKGSVGYEPTTRCVFGASAGGQADGDIRSRSDVSISGTTTATCEHREGRCEPGGMTSTDSGAPYQTRRRTKAATARGSRVDRRRTRVGLLSYLEDSGDDSETPGSSSESSSSTESSEEGRQTANAVGDKSPVRGDSDEEQGVSRGCRARRKRPSTTVISDTSSDSSSDVCSQPLRKVLPKKRLSLQLSVSDSDLEAAERQVNEDSRVAEAQGVTARRKERHKKLVELSERKKAAASRSRRRTLEEPEKENGEEKGDNEDHVPHGEGKQHKDEDAPAALAHISDEEDEDTLVVLSHSSQDEEEDSDSLKDFIVGDDENSEEIKAQVTSVLSRHLPHMVLGSQQTHFQLVVKALLINVLDSTFLKSLYDGVRTKRYAQEMKNSLYHLDHHYVLPHLENLKGRSRWSERYKERVDCYPNVRIVKTGGCDRTCEACELHRNTSFHVRLSGQLYDYKTLQDDAFLPDDTQVVFRVGCVCASRTEVYHQLKHFKYHLFCRCRTELQREGVGHGQEEEESVKDTVSRVFARLLERGWISQEYEQFEKRQHAAAFFQEEKLD